MTARAYLKGQRYDDAIDICQTSLAIAQRLEDELRMASAWYLMAEGYEQQGNLEKAADLLERVVRVDEKYDLPKLEANRKRLARLRANDLREHS